MSEQKKIIRIHSGNGFHWVGDGFRVNNYFPGHVISAMEADPFFLLDYNAPIDLAPADKPRGVGTHPHKGFETVSIVWEGAISHHDSAGNSGSIGAGGVQWMTAGAGILHKEFHEMEFTKRGGKMHMAQLWVNLPAKHKLTKPAYQDLQAEDISGIILPQEAGVLRLIAGTFEGQTGAAKTFSPVHLYDVVLRQGKSIKFSFSEGDTLLVLVAYGSLNTNEEKIVTTAQLALFDRKGSELELLANIDSHFLVLAGTPLNEPIVHYGPFVMNTQDEIKIALDEFRSGKFGVLD